MNHICIGDLAVQQRGALEQAPADGLPQLLHQQVCARANEGRLVGLQALVQLPHAACAHRLRKMAGLCAAATLGITSVANWNMKNASLMNEWPTSPT